MGGRHILALPLPGAPPLNPAVAKRLAAAWAKRPAGYRPRTRHLNPDGSPQYTNRLFLESSPYLLQHAHNPVNWYPWGDEAFEAAASWAARCCCRSATPPATGAT